jgi:hypothetical protein
MLAVDINPENNIRKKSNMNGNNYFVYQNMMNGNYMLKYDRNTLQLNQGPSIISNDCIGLLAFSDISFMAGVADIADFDNDGNRDIIITNGYPRDVTARDFAAFRSNSKKTVSKMI